jgi:hypothetical protein
MQERNDERAVMSILRGETYSQNLQLHFRVWHEPDMPARSPDVRCWGHSGKHLLAASISPFDPEANIATSVAYRQGKGPPPEVPL